MVMRRAGAFACDVGQAIVDEVRDESVDDAVVTFSTVLTGRHQLQVPEERELVTHRRHRETEGMGKVTHAELVVGKGVHQPQAERIRQREKDFDGFPRRGVRREITAELRDLLAVGNVGQFHSHS